jgi:hypothetical protein
MENNKELGLEKFSNFLKSIQPENTKFDYFNLLEHLSTNKIDKERIINLFQESIIK